VRKLRFCPLFAGRFSWCRIKHGRRHDPSERPLGHRCGTRPLPNGVSYQRGMLSVQCFCDWCTRPALVADEDLRLELEWPTWSLRTNIRRTSRQFQHDTYTIRKSNTRCATDVPRSRYRSPIDGRELASHAGLLQSKIIPSPGSSLEGSVDSTRGPHHYQAGKATPITQHNGGSGFRQNSGRCRRTDCTTLHPNIFPVTMESMDPTNTL
jgi:hypothetical protein